MSRLVEVARLRTSTFSAPVAVRGTACALGSHVQVGDAGTGWIVIVAAAHESTHPHRGAAARAVLAALAAKGLRSRKGTPLGVAQVHAMACAA